MSQADLAREVGTSPSHLNKLEDGQRAATVVTLEVLARALRVSIADFFTDDASPRRPAPDRALLALVEELRGREPEYIHGIRAFMRTLDAEVERATRRR